MPQTKEYIAALDIGAESVKFSCWNGTKPTQLCAVHAQDDVVEVLATSVTRTFSGQGLIDDIARRCLASVPATGG